jgi:hypothetical protein
VRYTASNSPRRTSRTARGNPWPSVLLRGEPMTSLLTARRQHLPAAYALHSRSKSVRLRTPPLPRLISPLWQGTASLCFTNIGVTLYYVSRSFRVSSQDRAQTGRTRSHFRISKCSRPPRNRSRNHARKDESISERACWLMRWPSRTNP